MQEQSISKGRVVLGTVGALIILFFVLCFRTVGVGQVGIITSFGHVTAEVQSGVVIKAPWPFQQLNTFDIKTQKDQAEAAAATSDLQDVKAVVVTNYHIDPNKVGELYRTVGTDYKVRLIDPAIQESVKATTAKFPIQELITKRQDLKVAALKNLRDRLAPRGITVEDISFTNMDFSDAFTKAIERKQVAEQEAQQAAYNIQKAENNAKANIAEANGRAEYQRIVQTTLTPETLQRLALDKWDGHLPQVTSGGTPFINIK